MDMQIWSALGTIFTAFATVALFFVTLFLYFATKRLGEMSKLISQGQAMSQLIHAINSSNQIILSNDSILRSADDLFIHEGLDKSNDAIQKRWLTFTLLNQWELFFLLHQKGHLGELSAGFWDTTTEQVLDRLLRNDFVHDLLITRGYHPEFVEFCTTRRSEMTRRSGIMEAPSQETLG